MTRNRRSGVAEMLGMPPRHLSPFRPAAPQLIAIGRPCAVQTADLLDGPFDGWRSGAIAYNMRG